MYRNRCEYLKILQTIKKISISILIFSEIISVSEKSLFTRLHFKTIRNNSHFGSLVFLTIFTQRFSSTAINTKLYII